MTMASAAHRSTPSLSVPPTQNTAPVFEHNCLSPLEIKRKQKRWQDGLLRYHTFNRRIMVFDVAGNRIGDTHWTGSAAVQEGDEVTLEKWGVLVEVAECIRRTETDLSELRAAQHRPTPMAARTPNRLPQQPRSSIRQETPQLKHKSLNAVLQNGGRLLAGIGPAARSPFELRHANNENSEWASERPSKRQRVETPSAAYKTPAALTTSSILRSSPPALGSHIRPNAAARIGRAPPKSSDVINLCDDEDDTSAHIMDLLRSEVPDNSFTSRQSKLRQPMARPSLNALQPENQRTSALRPDRFLSSRTETPQVQRTTIGPGRDTMRGQTREVSAIDAARIAPRQVEESHVDGDPQGMALKMFASTSRKKKTLFCQSQLTQRPVRTARQPRKALAAIAAAILDSTQDSEDDAFEPARPARREPADLHDAQQANPATRVDHDEQANPHEDFDAIEDDLALDDPPGPDQEPPKNAENKDRATTREGATVPKLKSAAAATSAGVTAKAAVPSSRPAPLKPAPRMRDAGPWSREAFDLFAWRPPGWDEEKWCLPAASVGAD